MECRLMPQGLVMDRFETNVGIHYFLSHLHKDHMSYIRSFKGLIYTSAFTAQFLGPGKQFPTTAQLVIVPEHRWTPFPAGEVAAIPSGHCAGAVMWAFRTTQGSYLYTGDWKEYPELYQSPILKTLRGHLDLCLWDNTLTDFALPPEVTPAEIHAWFRKHPQGVVESRSLGLETLRGVSFQAVGPHRTEMRTVHTQGYPLRAQVDTTSYPVLRLSATWYIHNMPTHSKNTTRMFFRTHASWKETQRLLHYLKPTVSYGCSGNENRIAPKKKKA